LTAHVPGTAAVLFSIFGALVQYERALTPERVVAELAAAKRRGRKSGRPPSHDLDFSVEGRQLR
jgi:DNA invertase Pin-like site-specific DNA recombinase